MDNFNENENSVNQVNPVNIEAQNAYIDSLQMNQSMNQDFVQEQAPTSETNSKRSIKKSKKPIFIVLLIIVLVVAAVVIVFGKLRSSNSIAGKFFGMLDGNMVKPFTRMADFGNSKDTTKFSMTLDMDEFSKLYGGMETDELGKYTLSAESSKKDDKFGYQVMIKREEDTAIDCQFVVEEEAIGINVEDITDGFITLKLSKEELGKLLNTLNITEEDIKDEYGMTFDEMVDMFEQYESEEVSFDLYKPYLKIITDKFDANIQTENNVKLTIGNEEVTTTKHFVVVDQKMVSEIMLSILETLKEDDETLEFIIQNYEEQYGIKIEKEEFVSSIDEAIEDIKEEMAETDEESMDVDSSFIVSIYKNGKDSVAIGLEVKDNYTDEISSEIIYAVLNNSDNSYAELVFKSEGSVVTIYMNVENVSNGYEGDCGLKIASGGYEMKCEFMTFELVETENDTEIIEKYENSNRVLNDMTASELEDLFEEIGENIENYMSSEAVELYPLGNILGTDTVDQANYAKFVMEIGNFSENVVLAALDEKVNMAIQGVIVNDAQTYYLTATGQKEMLIAEVKGVSDYIIPVGYVIPESIKVALGMNENNILGENVAYLIDDKSIDGYEDIEELNFCGDNRVTEYHLITSYGEVFTIPGYKEVQADGSIRYYINTKTDQYYTVVGNSDLEPDSSLAIEADPIDESDFTELYGVLLGEDGNNEVKTESEMYEPNLKFKENN